MANVIIKSDERRAYEDRVLQSFGGNRADSGARSHEAYSELKRMEEKHR